MPRSSPPRTRLVAAAFVLAVAMGVIALSAVSLNSLLEIARNTPGFEVVDPVPYLRR